jgi:hypothetical protein
LASILASDGFLPRQFTSLGDRLVFANGIIFLAAATGALIVIFQSDTHALVPLFAIGAFLAFTLSQAGMVLHWWKSREKGWLTKTAINGIGATVTGLTLLVVAFSKFIEGAWISILAIPIIVVIFSRIKTHYRELSKQLSLKGLPPDLKPFPLSRVIVPISGVHRGIVDAMDFAQSISKNVTAVYVEMDKGDARRVVDEWKRWWPDIPLVVLSSPYRSIIGPLFDFLDLTDQEHNDGQLAAVVLPEFVPARWWQHLLHNQTSLMIKTALLYRRRNLGFQRIIIDVPYHLKK